MKNYRDPSIRLPYLPGPSPVKKQSFKYKHLTIKELVNLNHRMIWLDGMENETMNEVNHLLNYNVVFA